MSSFTVATHTQVPRRFRKTSHTFRGPLGCFAFASSAWQLQYFSSRWLFFRVVLSFFSLLSTTLTKLSMASVYRKSDKHPFTPRLEEHGTIVNTYHYTEPKQPSTKAQNERWIDRVRTGNLGLEISPDGIWPRVQSPSSTDTRLFYNKNDGLNNMRVYKLLPETVHEHFTREPHHI